MVVSVARPTNTSATDQPQRERLHQQQLHLQHLPRQKLEVAEVLVGLATDTTVYLSRRGEALKVNKLTFTNQAHRGEVLCLKYITIRPPGQDGEDDSGPLSPRNKYLLARKLLLLHLTVRLASSSDRSP